jgi:Big-like domain-containing protein/WD40 repeat protein
MPARRKNNGGSRGGPRIPQGWLSGWLDPELEELFRDQPELVETARLLRASRPETTADPHYRAQLRNHLMAEAERSLRRRGLFGWLRPSPAHFAWGGAGLGVALIGATVLTLLVGRIQDHQNPITAFSTVSAQHAVSPGEVITVAFNQAMDQHTVVAGLHIEPATQVQTSWQGNNLVITPVHHLAGNTPYTVTIDQPALRAASGTTAQAPLQITFGTAPTPPPGPSTPTPPGLAPTVLGQVGSGGQVLFAPDGSVVSTAGVAPITTPAPSPATSPNASPSASASASPAESPSGPPANSLSQPATAVLEYPAPGATPVTLAGPATAAAFSPDGSTLAIASTDSNGGSKLVLSLADGSKPATLVSVNSAISSLVWAGADRLVYATGSTISSVVPSTGVVETMAKLPSGSGGVVSLAPGGAFAYVAPGAGTGGELLTLADGKGRLLAGSLHDVAFSGDGKSVAWVDRSSARPRILIEPVDRDAPASVSNLDPGADLGSLSLNRDGTVLAYVLTPPAGSGRLVIAQLPSGAPIAVGPAASSAAFSPSGGAIAFVTPSGSGSQLQLASIPGVSVAPLSALPAAANDALHAFVDAQVEGDPSALITLGGPGVDAAATTPKGLSRANIISAAAQPGGDVVASVELIVDPTAAHTTALVADETLTLARSADKQNYVVTAIDASPLHDLAAGPHVVRVGAITSHGVTALQVGFDSDLNPNTVAAALHVLAATGRVLPATVAYDANSRTATITLSGPYSGALTVTVDTTLRDVNDQPPASAFTAHVAGS